MIGFTKDEGFSPIGSAKSIDGLKSMLDSIYPDGAQELRSLYPFANDLQAQVAAKHIARDSTLGISMWKWAKYQEKYTHSSAYAYVFSRKNPYTEGITFDDHNPKTVGAYHSADIPYWFETLDSLNLFRTTRTYTEFDRKLSDEMSDIIVTFAATGDPTTKDVSFQPY